MKTPTTIPDLKKQVREEFRKNNRDSLLATYDADLELIDKIIDRTLAFAKEATLLEEKEISLYHGNLPWPVNSEWNEARKAQLKKWEKLLSNT